MTPALYCLQLIKELELIPVLALNTHVHADHITGTAKLKKHFPELKSALSKTSGGVADVLLEPGQKVTIGEQELEVRATPGHTNGKHAPLLFILSVRMCHLRRSQK